MNNFGPPLSDSDDDYDGFYFNDTIATKRTRVYMAPEITSHDQLHKAVIDGDIEELKKLIRSLKHDVNAAINYGYTLLMHACREGQLEIVQYLLEVECANANRQVDSYTPLLLACECDKQDESIVLAIVDLLLIHDAVINIADKYGLTPLISVSKKGYTSIVRRFLNSANVDAYDNQRCTPLFHAVKNNHPEVVKLLVKAGADTTIPNDKNYTVIQVAQSYGFCDILELLPKQKEKAYTVPSCYLLYNTLKDYIPRIFLKGECPEYFQEINAILNSINMTQFVDHFGQAHISLSEFITMDDKNLEMNGIIYPVHRRKILKGLLDFHLHHWSHKSIGRVDKNSKNNFYELLLITANHLQHVVVIRATLQYVRQHLNNGTLGCVEMETIFNMRENLKTYRKTCRDLQQKVIYLSSFSPRKNPLFINKEAVDNLQRCGKIKFYFKFTTIPTIIVGISILLCKKIRVFF